MALNHEGLDEAEQQDSVQYCQSGKRTEKPAVGGVPPQEVLTNSRLTYLTNRDAAQKHSNRTAGSNNAVLRSAKSAEGQVFERLAKQAEIYHNLQKQKKDLQDQSTVHPTTGREMFKPQINQGFYIKDRPQNSGEVTQSLHLRHKFN